MQQNLVTKTPEKEIRPQGTKSVTVKFSGGARPAETLWIQPGLTAFEVLNKLNLGNGFILSKGTPDTVFALDEILYPRIQDGDLLYAGSAVDAGN